MGLDRRWPDRTGARRTVGRRSCAKPENSFRFTYQSANPFVACFHFGTVAQFEVDAAAL